MTLMDKELCEICDNNNDPECCEECGENGLCFSTSEVDKYARYLERKNEELKRLLNAENTQAAEQYQRAEKAEAERDALDAWQCESCGARFANTVNPICLEGVKRCSKCVENEVLARDRDELKAELEQTNALLESAKANQCHDGCPYARTSEIITLRDRVKELEETNNNTMRILTHLYKTASQSDVCMEPATIAAENYLLEKQNDPGEGI
jgi:hypothetical protein